MAAASLTPAPSAPPAIRIQGVSKTFGSTRALRDVSFEIPRASVHALCGGNGSGKSTLIKILAGVYQADEGTLEIDGQVHDATRTNPTWAEASGLHFVHQAVGAFPSMTVAENFAVGSTFGARALAPVPWRNVHRRVQEVLDRFEIAVSPKAVMAQLAPATQTMLAVARALQNEAEAGRGALVLDEPTASLPSDEAAAVLDAMRGYARRGHAVIFVTHRLTELLAAADSATFLRDGRHIETCKASVLDERGLIERITGQPSSPADLEPAQTTRGSVRLELSKLSAGPLDDISFDVHAGEILGVAGLLGSGRSTLLQTLFGVKPARSGSARLDGTPMNWSEANAAIRAGIAYVPEDRAGQAAFPELPVRTNISAPNLRRYWNGLRLRRAPERSDAQAAIEHHNIKVSGPEAPFATMSGGNQQKVVMARWLGLAPRLLLLDEPTQGVDVGARSTIHQHVRDIAATGTAVLVVSSEPQELVDLCHRVIGLHQGRLVGEASGNELTVQRCTELGHGLTDRDGTPGGELKVVTPARFPQPPTTTEREQL